ncbi:hypothetical protein [Saccharopolyspora shandongensis]|uniref:hypothetical protein n=1 Tax=Saccharopolyspora shandongensis TaxID=418495 RepID=UPI0033D872CA
MSDLTELHAAARRLAQAFLADAGETATTWLRITPGVTETTHPAGSAHFRLGLDFHEAQSELVDLLRSEAGPLVVELAVHESGSFDLACTADLDSRPGRHGPARPGRGLRDGHADRGRRIPRIDLSAVEVVDPWSSRTSRSSEC